MMPRTGRPREFDKEEALAQAMTLFWEHGYEATSLAQLKAAMGAISPASFYAAFGSKEALFRAALDRYLATHGQVMRPLSDPGLSPRCAIEGMLRLSAKMQTDGSHPAGCLVILSSIVGSPENRHVQARLAEERNRNRAAIRGCVDRAIASGELLPDTDAVALTGLFDAFLAGLSVQARDGLPFEAIAAAIDDLMSVWDRHVRADPGLQAPAGGRSRRSHGR